MEIFFSFFLMIVTIFVYKYFIVIFDIFFTILR